ncbi:MAG: DUF6293 family protein [Thermoplasmatota archaeon]
MNGEPRRIHVIPMGLELDRIIGGLKEYPTNRVILLNGRDPSTEIERMSRKNGQRIREMVRATMDIEEIELDIFDFYKAARQLRKLFQDLADEGWSVHVNLSTGNRIVSSAALLASFMTGATPYYVRPERYSIPEDQEVLSYGVEEVIRIPSVRIMGPDVKQETVLRVLGGMGGSARHETSLIAPLDEVKNFFTERKEGESKRAHLARKRAFLSRTLRNMEREGYISLQKRGRFVNVVLSETGALFSGQVADAGNF